MQPPSIRAWFDPRRIAEEYRVAFRTPGYVVLMLISVIVLCGALYVNFWAIDQATEEAGPQIEDLILSNFPAVEVDGFFVYGTFTVIVLAALIIFARPRSIPFVVHGLTLFMVARSGFTLLTHLGPPEALYTSDFGNTITDAFFGSDQFFSGHTGMTFLGALAYWRVPWIRTFFMAASLYFVAIVLLGHIHYSIDVASAFCITYCIYRIALWAFEREYGLFVSDISG